MLSRSALKGSRDEKQGAGPQQGEPRYAGLLKHFHVSALGIGAAVIAPEFKLGASQLQSPNLLIAS